MRAVSVHYLKDIAREENDGAAAAILGLLLRVPLRWTFRVGRTSHRHDFPQDP